MDVAVNQNSGVGLVPSFERVTGEALDDLIEKYNALYKEDRTARKEGGKLSGELQQEFNRARALLKNSLDLVEVTSETPDILEAAAGKDGVHELNAASAEEILEWRAGGVGKAKRTFALVKPESEGRKREVITVIYGHFSNAAQTNANDILTAQNDNVSKPTVATFYSVTNIGKISGAASILIDQGLDYIRECMPTIEEATTLSPMRGFAQWANDNDVGDLREMTHGQQQQVFLAYLSDPKARDLARNLHVFDKEALLDAVYSKANVLGSNDDVYGDGEVVPMARYWYSLDPDERERQKAEKVYGSFEITDNMRAQLLALSR